MLVNSGVYFFTSGHVFLHGGDRYKNQLRAVLQDGGIINPRHTGASFIDMRETPRDPVDTSELRPRSRWVGCTPFRLEVKALDQGSKTWKCWMLGQVQALTLLVLLCFIYLESPEEKGGRQGATSHSGKHADICRLTPSCRSVKPAKRGSHRSTSGAELWKQCDHCSAQIRQATSLGSTMQHLTQAGVCFLSYAKNL